MLVVYGVTQGVAVVAGRLRRRHPRAKRRTFARWRSRGASGPANEGIGWYRETSWCSWRGERGKFRALVAFFSHTKKTFASRRRQGSFTSTMPKRNADEISALVRENLEECPICMDRFTGPIWQCSNGHIICDDCYCRGCALAVAGATCAECRVQMTEPSRNRLAENLRDHLPFPCPNEGCDKEFRSKDLRRHAEHECPKRPNKWGRHAGYRYHGQWKDGKPDGNGKVFHQHGSQVQYRGAVKQGKADGHGTLYWSDSEGNGQAIKKYKGAWKMGERDGTGTSWNRVGSIRYRGGWEKNIRHGDGCSFYSTANNVTTQYDGQWCHGQRDGRGKWFRINGSLDYNGEWAHGVRVA